MRETLYIRLLSAEPLAVDELPVEWLIGEDKGQYSSTRSGSLLQASAEASAGRQVIVIAPDDAVLLTTAELPPRSGSQVQRIVPFLLEEQLAEDISQSHFALATKQRKGHHLPVAVVSDALMQHWLTLFADNNLHVQALVPASLCIESIDDHGVTVLINNEHAWVRHGAAAGLFTDLHLLPAVLPGIQPRIQPETQAGSGTETAATIHINAVTVDHNATAAMNTQLATLRDALPQANLQLTDHVYPDVLTALAQGWQPQTLNLLQGKYSQGASSTAWLHTWRMAAVLVITLGLIATIHQWLQVDKLETRSQLLGNEINRVFRTALPSVNVIQDPVAQMQQALNGRSPSSGSDSEFMPLYALIATQLNQNSAVKLQQISWKNNQLELELRLTDVQHADQLAKQINTQLENSAFAERTVRIGSVNQLSSGGYKAKLSL